MLIVLRHLDAFFARRTSIFRYQSQPSSLIRQQVPFNLQQCKTGFAFAAWTSLWLGVYFLWKYWVKKVTRIRPFEWKRGTLIFCFCPAFAKELIESVWFGLSYKSGEQRRWNFNSLGTLIHVVAYLRIITAFCYGVTFSSAFTHDW